MATYTRWGKVRIIYRHGEQLPPYFKHPMHLVTVRYLDEPEEGDGPTERAYWLEFMKADGGWPELSAAHDAASLAELHPDQLAKAFHEAE